MTEIHQISVNLSEGQKRKLASAYRKGEGVTIRLGRNALSGSDVLMVPMNVVKRLAKSKSSGNDYRLPYQRIISGNKMVAEYLAL